MAKDDPYFRMRIPREIKDWIENEAKENKRSQNGQIIYCIEQQKSGRSVAEYDLRCFEINPERKLFVYRLLYKTII